MTLRERLAELAEAWCAGSDASELEFAMDAARIALTMALEVQTLVRNNLGAHEVVTVPVLKRLLASLDKEGSR